jgi:hypothetical protein
MRRGHFFTAKSPRRRKHISRNPGRRPFARRPEIRDTIPISIFRSRPKPGKNREMGIVSPEYFCRADTASGATYFSLKKYISILLGIPQIIVIYPSGCPKILWILAPKMLYFQADFLYNFYL